MTQMPASPQQSPGSPSTGRPGELLDRFLARLVDGILLAVVNVVIVSMIVVGALMGESASGYMGASSAIASVVATVLATVINLAYFVFMEATRGQTVGKMLLKLQTFGPTGTHPTVEQSLRRNIFMAFGLAGLVPVIGGITGGIAQLVAVIMIAVGINNDPARRQAWHDRFAGGTYVLKVG